MLQNTVGLISALEVGTSCLWATPYLCVLAQGHLVGDGGLAGEAEVPGFTSPSL